MSNNTFKSTMTDRTLTVEVYHDRPHIGIEGGSTAADGFFYAPADAPALALAILEAAGVAVWNHSVLTYGTKEHLENIAMNLKNYIEQEEQAKFRAMKESADREALEKRRDEVAKELGGDAISYKMCNRAFQNAISRIIELEDKVKS